MRACQSQKVENAYQGMCTYACTCMCVHYTRVFAFTGMAADIPRDFNISASRIDVNFSNTTINLDRLQLGPIEYSGLVSISKLMHAHMHIWPHVLELVQIHKHKHLFRHIKQRIKAEAASATWHGWDNPLEYLSIIGVFIVC